MEASLAQHNSFLDTEHGGGAVGCKLVCWNADGSQGRNDSKDGGDHEPHRHAGNEHRHRAHYKDGCRAARANFDGAVADVDQKTPQGRRKLGRQGWSTQRCGESLASWTHLRGSGRQITLSYVGQLETNLKNAWKKSLAPERVSARSKTAALRCTSCS